MLTFIDNLNVFNCARFGANKIHAPRRQCLSICWVVSQTARETPTRLITQVNVQAKLDTFAVHL